MGIGGGPGGESFARPSGERLASNRHELAEAAHEGGLRTSLDRTNAFEVYVHSLIRGLKLPLMVGSRVRVLGTVWWVIGLHDDDRAQNLRGRTLI